MESSVIMDAGWEAGWVYLFAPSAMPLSLLRRAAVKSLVDRPLPLTLSTLLETVFHLSSMAWVSVSRMPLLACVWFWLVSMSAEVR